MVLIRRRHVGAVSTGFRTEPALAGYVHVRGIYCAEQRGMIMSESPIEPEVDPEASPTEEPDVVPSSDPHEGGAIPVGPAQTDPDSEEEQPAL